MKLGKLGKLRLTLSLTPSLLNSTCPQRSEICCRWTFFAVESDHITAGGYYPRLRFHQYRSISSHCNNTIPEIRKSVCLFVCLSALPRAAGPCQPRLALTEIVQIEASRSDEIRTMLGACRSPKSAVGFDFVTKSHLDRLV